MAENEHERIVETPVEAKQGTDTPTRMPVVLVISTVGAALGMGLVWAYFF